MADFALDPTLAKDTVPLEDWALCRVLLMNDAQYPWLVLAPARAGLRDFHDLAPADLALATDEIVRASKALQALFAPDKLNVAALGNMTPQLHIHVIARFTGDAAWPKPVWGARPGEPYGEAALTARIGDLREAFSRISETEQP